MINLFLNVILVSLVVYFMYYKTNQMQEGLEGLRKDLSGLKLITDAIKNGKDLRIERRNNSTCYCVDNSPSSALSEPNKDTRTRPSLDNVFPDITQTSSKESDDEVSGKELVSIMEEIKSKGFRVEPFV